MLSGAKTLLKQTEGVWPTTQEEEWVSEPLPVVSEELGSAHHMEDEEGGGEKQRLVHRLPRSHVPPRSGSHTRLRASWREEERRTMKEREEEEEGGVAG